MECCQCTSLQYALNGATLERSKFNTTIGGSRMVRKISFAILACAVGSFLIGSIGGHRVQIGYDGAVTWAQDSIPADDGDAAEPEPNKKSPPPNVRGSWCGSINDNQLGSGTISLAITQKGSNPAVRGRTT